MNIKQILLGSVITSIVGIVLGLALAEVSRADYHPDAHKHYAIAGAVLGALIGGAQDSLRQLEHNSRPERELWKSSSQQDWSKN